MQNYTITLDNGKTINTGAPYGDFVKYATSLTRDRDAAEDTVLTVLSKVANNPAGYGMEVVTSRTMTVNPRFILADVKQRCVDYLRARTRLDVSYDALEDVDTLANVGYTPAEFGDVEVSYALDVLDDAQRAVWHGLTERTRQVLLAYHASGCDFAETQKRLGLNTSAGTRGQVYRAQKEMRVALG